MCLIKSFFKWLYDADDESVPPVVRWIKRKEYVGHNRKILPSEILTPKEIIMLVNGAPITRDAAFIFALFESGCRVTSEFLPVKIKDLTINGRYACFDIKGELKTSYSERTCYLIRSWPYVRNWLNVHPNKNNPEAPLWPSIRGKTFGGGLTHDGAVHILNRAKKNCGLKKKIWMHLLRHSRAVECAKKGYNNQVMNKMFGWSDSSDMASWYISLSKTDVREVVLQKEGLADEVKKDLSTDALNLISCPKCGLEHGAGTKFCTCGFVLDEREAIKLDLKKEEKSIEMMNSVLRDVEQLKEQGLDFKEIAEFLRIWRQQKSQSNDKIIIPKEANKCPVI